MKVKYSIEQVFGCWQSYDEDMNPLVYAGSKWECEFWTETMLRDELKDGKVKYNSTVGGKL